MGIRSGIKSLERGEEGWEMPEHGGRSLVTGSGDTKTAFDWRRCARSERAAAPAMGRYDGRQSQGVCTSRSAGLKTLEVFGFSHCIQETGEPPYVRWDLMMGSTCTKALANPCIALPCLSVLFDVSFDSTDSSCVRIRTRYSVPVSWSVRSTEHLESSTSPALCPSRSSCPYPYVCQSGRARHPLCLACSGPLKPSRFFFFFFFSSGAATMNARRYARRYLGIDPCAPWREFACPVVS
ncbi:hypothetical protein CSPX01_00168 [Colletotrichum filicis]|nr:hypothetical protein CSPX01_00168 [Colletotrichum filicis]